MTQQALGALVRRYRARTGLTQGAVAHLLGEQLGRRVHQTQVSDNEKGARWNDPDLAGAYVTVLGIPPEEMAAAYGFGGGSKSQKPPTIADVVKADPTLSAAAKKHILAQYQLLQLATLHERGQGKPDAGSDSRSATG